MQKKKTARDRSVQELTGITGIRDYGVSTQFGDIVFFIVKPTNISVLPESSVTARVQSLMNVIREQDGLEFLAMNSRESFEQNKIFYRDSIWGVSSFSSSQHFKAIFENIEVSLSDTY